MNRFRSVAARAFTRPRYTIAFKRLKWSNFERLDFERGIGTLLRGEERLPVNPARTHGFRESNDCTELAGLNQDFRLRRRAKMT
ncbi:MAG TPA: hypothetical protein VEJ67_14465 [Candidatus Cybelea sp.]|nr:hypothetical protein [Candidatus Cybelea sp.]